MKKILLLIGVCVLLGYSAQLVHAQGMMGGFQNTTTTEFASQSSTQDEAAGKAIWDKLQNKQVTCANLTDDDFDVLGDFFMGNMMGSSYDYMDQLMTQRLGSDGEKQMHIAMGKRLSGCDTNAVLPSGSDYFTPMMGNFNNVSWSGGTRGMMGYGFRNGPATQLGLVWAVTWLALMTFLVSGTVLFWKMILRKNPL